MQEINISFQGINLSTPPDICPDGQLETCVGLEMHNGALRPSVLDGDRYILPQDENNYRLVHVHSTAAYPHFILSVDDDLYWANVNEGDLSVSFIGSYPGFSTVNSVGNTLVVLSSSGIDYSLWKEGTYMRIGQKPPEIGITFGLSISTYDRISDEGSVSIVPSEAFSIDINRQVSISDKDNQREYITDVVWGAVNKVIDACSENNRFCMPFFVRAAYRRFDGSYTMLTSPVLMIPDSTGPKAFFVFENKEAYKITGKIYGRAWAALLVAAVAEDFASGLTDWSDIISSVDIFVSPQVMRADNSDIISILYGPSESELTWHSPPASYGIGSFSSDGTVYNRTNFDWQVTSTSMKYFKIPMKDEEAFLQDLNGKVQFYKVRSIPLGQLSSMTASVFKPVLEKSLDLSNIAQQETLPDSADYQSHDHLTAMHSYVYNQRLHLFDLERTLFQGFFPEFAWSYTNDGAVGDMDVYVYIASEDGITRVVKATSYGKSISQLGRFLYYPDVNANRMIIVGSDFRHDIPLQPHPLLNGAYHIFMDTEPVMSAVSVPEVSDSPVSLANKIYTSEVGNPYYFPLEGIYTVGTGKILALSSVATALSQGQFGQFPLMVLASDGNYAMSVNGEGRYSTIHPIQRDVCINPEAVVQTDSEVLFVSSRGVMVTSGAAVNCISSELDGVPENMPEAFVRIAPPQGRPVDFFRTCRIAYDYTNRRIIFFSTHDANSYVYSMESAFWSSASFGPVISAVNIFPYSYVQVSGGKIFMLSTAYAYEGELQKGIIYTRPVKLGTMQLKRLFRVALQGTFSGRQNISIYASNDCKTWHYIGTSCSSEINSLCGRSAKYWRFLIETELSPSENVTSLRIHCEPRKEKRFR